MIKDILITLIAVGALMLFLYGRVEAQSGTKFAWEYTEQQVIDNEIVRFELQIDEGAWVDVGMNLLNPADPDTYFTPIPSGTVGEQHNAEIRACSVVKCSNNKVTYTLTGTMEGSPGGAIPPVIVQ